MHAHIQAPIHAEVRTRSYTLTFMQKYTQLRTNTGIHANKQTRTYAHINSHMHTYTNVRTNTRTHTLINSFIPAISIALLQVLYYSEALPTTARILYRIFTPKRTGNCR